MAPLVRSSLFWSGSITPPRSFCWEPSLPGHMWNSSGEDLRRRSLPLKTEWQWPRPSPASVADLVSAIGPTHELLSFRGRVGPHPVEQPARLGFHDDRVTVDVGKKPFPDGVVQKPGQAVEIALDVENA